MKVFELSAKRLSRGYEQLGIDISKLIKGVDSFELHVCDEFGLKTWKPSIVGDSGFYASLSKHQWYYLNEKKEFEIARKYAHQKVCLEFGCGAGHFGRTISALKYVGLELNENAAKQAREEANLDVRVESLVEHCQKNSGVYDCVFSFQVLEHLSEPFEYFKAAFELLKPGGVLITALPSEDSFLAADQNSVLNAPPHHLTKWTDDAIRRVGTKYGFRTDLIEHIPVESYHTSYFLWVFFRSLLKAKFPFLDSENWHSKLILGCLVRVLIRIVRPSAIPKELNIPGHSVVVVQKKFNEAY